MSTDIQSRYLGSLLGLAVGDTLGAPVQFNPPGSFSTRQPPEIKGSGYVVRSMEAALWVFF